MVEVVQPLLFQPPGLQGYFAFVLCELLAQPVSTQLQVAPVVRLPEQEETGGTKARDCPDKALPKSPGPGDYHGSEEER